MYFFFLISIKRFEEVKNKIILKQQIEKGVKKINAKEINIQILGN